MSATRQRDPLPILLDALWRRHLADLTFAEVRRGVQALWDLYVHRRGALGRGGALDGAGKRAAFAMFYGPLHLLTVRRVVMALGAAGPPPRRLLDLGCGSGAAGAGWALEAGRGVRLEGIDQSGWAVSETRLNWRSLGLRGRASRGDVAKAPAARREEAVVCGYLVNELSAPGRERLRDSLLQSARRGARVLVVEAVARRPVPWWDDWARAFVDAGGRDDLWRFEAELPQRLRELDRAAGLDHRELKARSLYLGRAA